MGRGEGEAATGLKGSKTRLGRDREVAADKHEKADGRGTMGQGGGRGGGEVTPREQTLGAKPSARPRREQGKPCAGPVGFLSRGERGASRRPGALPSAFREGFPRAARAAGAGARDLTRIPAGGRFAKNTPAAARGVRGEAAHGVPVSLRAPGRVGAEPHRIPTKTEPADAPGSSRHHARAASAGNAHAPRRAVRVRERDVDAGPAPRAHRRNVGPWNVLPALTEAVGAKPPLALVSPI